MEKQFDAYIENLVTECMAAQPNLTHEALRDHFLNIIMDTVVDNLSPEQINEVSGLTSDMPKLTAKIEEFASTMPNILSEMEKNLQQAKEIVKQNGQIPLES